MRWKWFEKSIERSEQNQHGFVSAASEGVDGASRQKPREAPRISSSTPFRLFESSPRLRSSSGLSLSAFIFLPFLIFLNNLHPISLAQGGEEQTRYDTDHLDLFRYSNPKSSSPFHFLDDHRCNACLSIPNLFASGFAGRRVTSLTCLEWKSLDSMELLFVFFLRYNLIMFFFFNFNFI